MRTISRKLSIAALALAAATALAVTPQAALAGHITCLSVIGASRTLDSNLVCTGDGLTIAASNITLDLNGHTISGAGSGVGIEILPGRNNVTITNGTVTGFEHGIFASGTDSLAIQGVTVTDNESHGVWLNSSDNATLDLVTAAGNGGDGILIDAGAGHDILTSVASSNGGDGLDLSGADIVVNRVSANGNVEDGMSIAASQVVVQHSSAGGNGMSGIVLYEGTRNRLRRNVTEDNGVDGMRVEAAATRTRLSRNTANRNDDDGIDVDGLPTRLDQNRANDNADWGFETVPGATDGGGNSASGNGTGNCDPAVLVC